MPKNDYRIFISYRGKSEGAEFASRLYDYFEENPSCKEIYGDVFYSPKSSKAGDNFKLDIPLIMPNVEYFVMPLTPDYFADFWDEEKDCPNSESITLIEIQAALKSNCSFVCVRFPGYKADRPLLHKLFDDDSEKTFYDKIACAIKLDYDPCEEKEEDLFYKLGKEMRRKDIPGISDFVKGCVPNVHLSFKKDTEKFPLFKKLQDVKHITLLNYASSSILTGIDLASNYEKSDYFRYWFLNSLGRGDIEADIIITDPYSSAAEDAALYKMYPAGLKRKKNEIMRSNLNRLYAIIRKYPGARLNVYLTHIALPYGVMMTEHEDPKNNHIKIDMYSAVTNDDELRPSLYLLQSDENTSAMYNFFSNNVRRIMEEYSYRFAGHPQISWLTDNKKSIIHRGVMKDNLKPHTKGAYDYCITKGYPMEVDLLQMKDGTIIVARDDQDISEYGYDKKLSELSKLDLKNINKKANDADKILTFKEFLELIGGKIPVLIEIKTLTKEMTPELESYVNEIVKILHEYARVYSSCFRMKYNTQELGFAVHSADPNVLKLIKEKDCLIPCGIITKDFSPIAEEVGEEFCNLHLTGGYTEIVTPDFISSEIGFLGSETPRKIAKKLNIPVIGWTVMDEDDQELAIEYCDNMIIEGAKTYITE